MYLILVRPDPTHLGKQLTSEQAPHLPPSYRQEQSAFLLIFEDKNEIEAFEHFSDNPLVEQQMKETA